MQITLEQKNLHHEAIQLCNDYRRLEWQIILVLQKIDKSKLYLKFEMTSVFQYAVKYLKLAEPTAYMFIAVARKSKTVPRLAEAIRDQKLSLSKASRIVSVVNEENAGY